MIASMYAVYHGPEGLTHIARTVHRRAAVLAAGLRKLGFAPQSEAFFDTVTVRRRRPAGRDRRRAPWPKRSICGSASGTLGIALDETTTPEDVEAVWRAFGGKLAYAEVEAGAREALPSELKRATAFLTPSGLPHAPLRDRDAALHAQALPTAISRSTAR